MSYLNNIYNTYLGNVYDYVVSCIERPEITVNYEIIQKGNQTILRLLNNGEQIVDLISTCQNEIENYCYKHKGNKEEKIICKPLENIISTECGIINFLSNIINIFTSDSDDQFINQGSFSTAFDIDPNTILRLTHSLMCSIPQEDKLMHNEIQGLFYQAYLSKPLSLGGLQCDYICKVYDFGKYKISDDTYLPTVPYGKHRFSSEEGIYAILEKVNGGELFDRIVSDEWMAQSPENKVRNTGIIIKQLLLGLQCIHNAGYVHMDIKPENILMESKDFNNNFIKIIDFGFVRKINQHKEGIFGSPYYISPEFINKTTFSFNDKFDIWAVGIITIVCLLHQQLDGKILYGTERSPYIVLPSLYQYFQILKMPDGDKITNFLENIINYDLKTGRIKKNPVYSASKLIETEWMKSVIIPKRDNVDHHIIDIEPNENVYYTQSSPYKKTKNKKRKKVKRSLTKS
tara:strand:+ start:1350 stop:2726 length:1377 start_codon:yes stop_codon:yes gene_type:complete